MRSGRKYAWHILQSLFPGVFPPWVRFLAGGFGNTHRLRGEGGIGRRPAFINPRGDNESFYPPVGGVLYGVYAPLYPLHSYPFVYKKRNEKPFVYAFRRLFSVYFGLFYIVFGLFIGQGPLTGGNKLLYLLKGTLYKARL